MLVVVALFELDIDFAQSLKDKRSVVKGLREKLRSRFSISAAEVGLQDVHQRARMAVAFISLDHSGADAMLDRIQTFVDDHAEARVAGWTTEKLEFDETVNFG